jgi:hypothetical protein
VCENRVFAESEGADMKEILIYYNTVGRSYTVNTKLMKPACPDIFEAMFADWKTAGQRVGNRRSTW